MIRRGKKKAGQSLKSWKVRDINWIVNRIKTHREKTRGKWKVETKFHRAEKVKKFPSSTAELAHAVSHGSKNTFLCAEMKLCQQNTSKMFQFLLKVFSSLSFCCFQFSPVFVHAKEPLCSCFSVSVCDVKAKNVVFFR